jgi:hypothetical protein
MEPEKHGGEAKWQHLALVGFVAGVLTDAIVFFVLG